ncbi:MAG: 2-hydroxyglutaryl-CoA dehydratase [Candidatus Lokiarchaeota archaeon]|nr:2-hydroxyglutaryl-CoA dehydratase [Candidatus Lokiarchaeota archaeon]
MITCGIDIGSLSTKAAFYDGKLMIGYYISRSGHEFERAGKEVYQSALNKVDLRESDIAYIVGTGYGRSSIKFSNKTITEISCHGKGAHYFLGDDIKTVIDIGGQDSKAISLGKNGKVIDFQMNDKCAAGTGRFIEVMAKALETPLEEMGKKSLSSKNPSQISSMCTVFAESEVISLFAKGEKKEDIIAGIHKSIAKRVVGMAKRISVREKVAFCGGVAKNDGVHKAIEDELKLKVLVPEEPQINGAIGAAILAWEEINKKN